MNRIWLFTISISILYAMINHNLDAMNEVMMQVGKDTFDFVVPLLCVTCFWNGILNVAKDTGVLKMIEKLFQFRDG